MIVLKGIPASDGYAIGTLRVQKTLDLDTAKQTVVDTQAELSVFLTAKEKALAKINALYQKALAEIGPEEAAIFEIHMLMLEDLDFNDSITNLIIEEKANASYAVDQTAKTFSQMFSAMDDEYMKARSADVLDISWSLLEALSGRDEIGGLDQISIYAAVDLLPSETVALDKNKILAFVTEKGSKTAHSAILARTMGIPSVVGLGASYGELVAGEKLIVDGFSGEIFIKPDEETLGMYEKKASDYAAKKEKQKRLMNEPSITRDGIHIEINANIGKPSDLEFVKQSGAEGVGLFRSEFLYMEGSDFPTEEEQLTAYRKVLAGMGDKPVIIRTLDLGADKHADYFVLDHEENPAMGYRAVRICLDQTDIFKTQLRALYRASVFGKLLIMVPMITCLSEVLKTKAIIKEVQADLKAQGHAFVEDVSLGIMIETPAAVLISDILAKHVDFFSIGTNDLTQYTLAADRMNSKIAALYDPRHPAVLRMIQMTAENGKRAGIWTGICGESASDLSLVPLYLAMGIRELSVTPGSVLGVREMVRSINVKEQAERLLNNLATGGEYELQNCKNIQQ